MRKIQTLLSLTTASILFVAMPAAFAEEKPSGHSAQGAINVTAGEVANNPGKYSGKRVRIQAEVEDVYNAHTFTLDEDQIFAGPDVLVLNPAPAAASKDGDDVTVTGTIRQFVRAEIERDYDWFDYNWLSSGEAEIDFTTRPLLIADSVRTSTGQELVQTLPSAPRAGDQPGSQ